MENIYLIKDVARLSGLSVFTVKFYLKQGLIKEIGRSPETGYRYFNDSTVTALEKIRMNRKIGLSLKKIKDVVTNGDGV